MRELIFILYVACCFVSPFGVSGFIIEIAEAIRCSLVTNGYADSPARCRRSLLSFRLNGQLPAREALTDKLGG